MARVMARSASGAKRGKMTPPTDIVATTSLFSVVTGDWLTLSQKRRAATAASSLVQLCRMTANLLPANRPMMSPSRSTAVTRRAISVMTESAVSKPNESLIIARLSMPITSRQQPPPLLRAAAMSSPRRAVKLARVRAPESASVSLASPVVAAASMGAGMLRRLPLIPMTLPPASWRTWPRSSNQQVLARPRGPSMASWKTKSYLPPVCPDRLKACAIAPSRARRFSGSSRCMKCALVRGAWRPAGWKRSGALALQRMRSSAAVQWNRAVSTSRRMSLRVFAAPARPGWPPEVAAPCMPVASSCVRNPVCPVLALATRGPDIGAASAGNVMPPQFGPFR